MLPRQRLLQLLRKECRRADRAGEVAVVLRIHLRGVAALFEHLLVSDETLQNRPDRHAEDLVEHRCREERAAYRQKCWEEDAVHLIAELLCDDLIEEHSRCDGDEEFAQDQHKLADDAHGHDAQHVACDQPKGFLRRRAE